MPQNDRTRPATAAKLVRDGLSGIIPGRALTRAADDREVLSLLSDKLVEEGREAADAGYGSAEEFADCLEVLMAMARRGGVAWEDVEAARLAKLASRGSFDLGLLYHPSLDDSRG